MGKYTMMTHFTPDNKENKFNFKDFNSIKECKEEMKKNGWKTREVSYIGKNGNMVTKKITV